jgi:hypothetical protein
VFSLKDVGCARFRMRGLGCRAYAKVPGSAARHAHSGGLLSRAPSQDPFTCTPRLR